MDEFNAITKVTSGYSDELKKYRKLMGFTQQSLGDSLGLDRRTILNWENGRTTIPNSKKKSLDELIAKWKIKLSELDGFEKPIEVVETNPTLESKYIALLEEQIKSLKARLSKYE